MAQATTKKAAKKSAPGPIKKKVPAHPSPLPRESLKPKDDIVVDPDVLDLIAAIDLYKKIHSRMFPSWSEVLFVVKQLGYRKSS